MFNLNGKPVRHCKDFYDNYNFSDIMEQKEKFIVFAENNLNFSDLNNTCISIFKNAVRNEILKPCTSCMSFWQGDGSTYASLERERKEKIKCLLEECFAYYLIHHKSEKGWERVFIMNAAANIIAERPFNKSVASERIFGSPLAVNPSQKTYKLYSGGIYDLVLSGFDESKITSIRFDFPSNGTSNAIIRYHDANITVSAGGCTWVNVMGKRIYPLPNIVECGQGTLERKTGRVYYCDNDINEATDISNTMSSFSGFGRGMYIYTDNQIIHTTNEKIPRLDRLCLKGHGIAEIQSCNDGYYVLTTEGRLYKVSGKCGDIRYSKEVGYLSISDAVGSVTL